jgi:hypothetical protein
MRKKKGKTGSNLPQDSIFYQLAWYRREQNQSSGHEEEGEINL